MTGRHWTYLFDFAIFTLSFLPLTYGKKYVTKHYDVFECSSKMWATRNLAASIHLEKPCAFNLVNVAGPRRHNILVEITGLSFTGDIDSAMFGRLDEDSSERDFTEADVTRAEDHCLRLTWVDHIDDFNVSYHESNRARRVDDIACMDQIPPWRTIYMLIEEAEGVKIELMERAKSVKMDMMLTSVYHKYSFEECPHGYEVCKEDRRVCIPKQLLCDGYNNCPGGTDEEQCKMAEEKREDGTLPAATTTV